MTQTHTHWGSVSRRSLAVLIAGLLLLALLSVFPVSNAAARYGAPVQITTGTTTQWDQKLVVDQNGKSHIVWTGTDPVDGWPKIWYGTNASGSWVNTQLHISELQQNFPYMAVDSNGKAHITWNESGGSHPFDVFYADNTSGVFVTTNLTNNPGGQHAQYPSIAVDPSGVAHVAWSGQSTPGGLRQIYYTSNPGGTWPVSPTQITNASGSQTGPMVAADSAGKAHLVWSMYVAGTRPLYYSDNTGGSWPAQPVIIPGSPGDRMQMAVDANRRTHVKWELQDAANVWQVYYSDDVTGTWSTVQLTNGATGYDAGGSDMALGPEGSAHMAWSTYSDASQLVCAFYHSDNSSGTWSSPALLATHSGDESMTSLAVDPMGRSHISYEVGLGSVQNNQIWCIDNVSGDWSTPVRITDTTDGNPQCEPMIETDSVGGVHLTWRGNNPAIGSPEQIWYWECIQSPYVSTVSPTSGAPGTQVAITGSYFGASQGTSRVTIDGVLVPVVSWSDTRIVVTIPEGAQSGPVVVTTGAGGSSNDDKTFTLTTGGASCYLAEGTNAWGFSTYITIENPYGAAGQARLTYMDPNPNPSAAGKGILKARTITLPARSQTTVSSMSDIGAVDFSTRVESLDNKTLAVDRTMYWTGSGTDLRGYHSSVGTGTPAKAWYLPEGSSNWGFETWTLVENPNDAQARVTLTYMTDAAGARTVEKTIPANSRATYSMSADIGGADASIKVTSDQPVVAERSMYRNNRREGSCSIGASAPSNDFYLSEGATGYAAGFTTWVLVQNPNGSENEVSLTFQTGAGKVAGPTFTMPANSRRTVKVNDFLPANTDVSTKVHGSKPLVAERAVYWNAGLGECFHASIGLSAPHMTFMLPDGQADANCQTWTLVQNPNPGAVTVRVTYMPQNGGEAVNCTAEIPRESRASFNMADKIKGRAAIFVETADGARPIMVERAMYGADWGSGTDTIGTFTEWLDF